LWIKHFQTSGLEEMFCHPGQHDCLLSPPHPVDIFSCGYIKDKLFSAPVPDIANLKARNN